MARVRSPNYPALSLPGALDRTRTLFQAEGRNSVAREAIAKHLGFGGLNGASATVLSALNKYGLIEAVDDGEARISDLAMHILHPETPEEKRTALQEAAFRPVLFAKLREKWPDRPPSDDGLRSYLFREGFSSSAVDQVIQFYRETLEIAAPRESEHDSSSAHVPQEEKMMATQAVAPQSQSSAALPALGGKPFAVGIDGDVLTGTIAIRSLRDFDRFLKVFTAQRIALEAVLEDEEHQGDL